MSKSKNSMQDTVADICEWHRHREDFLAAEGNLTRQIKSVLRRIVAAYLGFSLANKNDRAKAAKFVVPLFKTARGKARIVVGMNSKGGRKTNPDPDKVLTNELIRAAAQIAPLMIALITVEEPRKHAEKKLIEITSTLPVASWVESIHGFGLLGLGQIIGEAGDLLLYPTRMTLWKRMGVGLIGDERQRKCKDKEKAILHGYNPKRRAILFNIGDSMIKNVGTYAPVYYREKERQFLLHPDILKKLGGKAHIHNRARRYMEKMVLRDLWQVWNGRKPLDYIPHGDAWPVLLDTAV